jgi:hypothetical protein
MSRSTDPAVDQPVPAMRVGMVGKGSSEGRASEPTAVILASDLLRWIIPKVGKFPRQIRYGLGGRIEAAHLDVLEELVHAQYSRGADRARSLEIANRRLQAARHLLRMAREMNLLSERATVYAAGLQVDLGNQVGAWKRAAAGALGSTANSSPACTTPPT